MKKLWLFSLVILFSSCVSTKNINFRKESLESAFVKINQDVSYRSKAYSKLGEATSMIGHRLTGSNNGKKAEEFAHSFLRESGFTELRFMPFEVETWSRDTVSLSIVPQNSDNFLDLKVVSLAHSPVNAHVKAEIVDCGDGLEEDFEAIKTQVKDKIVLVNLGLMKEENKGKKNLHRSEKTALAIQYGAAGVIMVNQVEGRVLLTGTASVTGSLIPIPAVCIGVEDGRAVRKWLNEKDEKSLLAIIDMRNNSRMIRARNVVATIRGTSKKHKNEKIIVGGHLDSWDLAQGATDNGIGSFSVLDMARTFQSAKLRPKRTIEFVMFMGEEQGLLGSRAMIKDLKAKGKLDQVKLMMNLDMANNPKGFNAYGRDELKTFFEEIGQKIKKIDTTYTNANYNQAGLHSDHQGFMIEGVPVCSPMGSLSFKVLNCYHADCDKFNLVDKQHITNTVRFSSMMLYALADADELPVSTLSSEQTRDYLIKQKLKNELIIGKDWRWGE